MSVLSLSRTSATLKRKVLVKDASGGMTMASYTTVSGYANVPCDIQPMNDNTRLQYMETQANLMHVILSESEIPAKAEDILVSNGGRTYQFRGRKPIPEGYESDQWPAEIHVEEQLG